MTTNRELIRELMDTIWNAKDLGIIDRVFDDGVVLHSPLGNYYGPEAKKRIVRTWLEGLPDIRFVPLDFICDGDKVAVQWECHATHKGHLRGIEPSGNHVTYVGTTIFQLRDSKVVEYWAYVDTQMVLDQLKDSPTAG